MELGNPTSGGARKKKNYFYISQGSNVYRILPPMGALAKDGIWSRYYEVHFGYVNKEGFMKPFQSCEVKSRDRKMIEVPCPAKERIKRWEDQLVQIKERIKTSPSAELSSAKAYIEALTGYEGQYNLEKRHYMNAMNDKGEIGLLALKHKEKLALEEALKQIEAKYQGLKANGIEGCFIEFRKSGKGLDTITQASGHMVLNADQSEKLNRHTVGPDIIPRLKDEAFELDKLYYAPTEEEIQSMVTASDTDLKNAVKEAKNGAEGAAVAAVFAKYEPVREQKAKTETKSEVKTEVKDEAPKVDPAVLKATQDALAGVTPSTPDLSMTEQAPAAKVETKTEVKAETKAAAPVVAVKDDDFLASIGVPK
jgi:hypothetical protein